MIKDYAVSYRYGSAAMSGEHQTSAFGPTAFKAASLRTQETYAWRPPLTSGDSPALYERTLAASRVRDVVRNDPHATSAVGRLVDMLVGSGLRVSPQPNARALGLDPTDEAQRSVLRDLTRNIKDEWNSYAKDPRRFCDAQRRLTQNGIWRLQAKTFVTTGECTGFMTWKPTAGARYASCFRAIDPDRLSNPMGRPDSATLRGGVEFDSDGVPLAYHVRSGHPADRFLPGAALTWEKIPRVTPWGRPVFVHAFEPDREDQSRAMTPFAALLTRLKMIGKFADTELANATVNALFAAFVKSNMPVGDATQSFNLVGSNVAADRIKYYGENPPTLNGVRIPVLPIGDEIELNTSPRQSPAFNQFQTAFLQSIAAALGISYEQISMDWSKVNYSSARAALNEVWRHVQLLMAQFVEQAVIPVYFAVMEEAFDRGYVVLPKGAPSFWDMPMAYLNGRWIGPGRGYIDPVKEAQAAQIRMAGLTSTLEKEIAEQGGDWEEWLDQMSLEEEELKMRGLTRQYFLPGRDAAAINDIADDPALEDATGDAQNAGTGTGAQRP